MAASPEVLSAQVSVQTGDGGFVLTLSGQWRITAPRPAVPAELDAPGAARVRVVVAKGTEWDSSLPLFLDAARARCRTAGIECDLSGLPRAASSWIEQFDRSRAVHRPADRSANFLAAVGLAARDVWRQARSISDFVGECALGARRLARSPRHFRWRDSVSEMQQCGAMALPIVSLTSFLVGVTLAYIGAIVLRLFGADIFVADLVGLSTVREMGAVMTAVVLAGRTGAAYAAQIANMKANEEIDALTTLGVSSIDFLVLPRVLAISVMSPLLALYANCCGILGGMAIARLVLDIPPTAYWIEMLTIVDLSDVSTGLIKALTFGLIVGLSGCMCGLRADRSAEGVGRAATSSVVMSVLFIIIADALYAVLFNALGW